MASPEYGSVNSTKTSSLQFKTREHKHTALADIGSTAVGNAGGGIARDDDSYWKVQPISLPAPEHRPLRIDPGSGLRCHDSDHNRFLWLDESYRSAEDDSPRLPLQPS
jgi:hypothetical protein